MAGEVRQLSFADGVTVSKPTDVAGVFGNGVPALTDWTAYTPSNGFGLGTLTDVNLEYMRLGSSMIIRGYFTSGTVSDDSASIGLPTGFTVGQPNGTGRMFAGHMQTDASSKNQNMPLMATPTATDLTIGLWANDNVATDVFTTQDADTFLLSTTKYSIATHPIPIAEWVGQGTLPVLVENNLSQWTSFTPAFSTDTTFTNNASRYRQVGENLEINMNVSVNVAGAGTDDIIFTIPNSYTLSTWAQVQHQQLGDGFYQLNSGAEQYDISAIWDITGIKFRIAPKLSSLSRLRDDNVTSGDILSVQMSFPVSAFEGTQNSVVSVGEATTAAAGSVKLNKWQRKTLAADVSTATTDMADLRFSNLTIGKTYKVSAQARIEIEGTSNTEVGVFTARHDGTAIFEIRFRIDLAPDDAIQTAGNSIIFTATTTTVTFDYGEGGTAILQGSSSFGASWSMIEELSNYSDDEATSF